MSKRGKFYGQKPVEGPLVRAFMVLRNGSPVAVHVGTGRPEGVLIPGAGERAVSDERQAVLAVLQRVHAKIVGRAQSAGLPVHVEAPA